MHLDCLKLAMMTIFTLWKLVNVINLGSRVFPFSALVFNYLPAHPCQLTQGCADEQEAGVGAEGTRNWEADVSLCRWSGYLASVNFRFLAFQTGMLRQI